MMWVAVPFVGSALLPFCSSSFYFVYLYLSTNLTSFKELLLPHVTHLVLGEAARRQPPAIGCSGGSPKVCPGE